VSIKDELLNMCFDLWSDDVLWCEWWMLVWYYDDDELLMYGCVDFIMQKCDDGVILYNGLNCIMMSLGD
jgi:hypothetical protein